LGFGTKWVFKNKKERMVGSVKQGDVSCLRVLQKEGIDYEETFAPVARLEAIRILLTLLL
jgi:hypothetical protein